MEVTELTQVAKRLQATAVNYANKLP